MIPLDTGANYYEIFINPSVEPITHGGQVQELSLAVSKNVFLNLLEQLHAAKTDFKFYQKEYKQYVYNDIIVHNYKNTETRVMKLNTLGVYNNAKSVMMGYSKNKLTFLNVPSTKNIYELSYVKRLIFRVSNRIFINFQTNLMEDGDMVYTVYINYNHESNIDPEGVQSSLKKILNIFDVSSDHWNPLLELV